MNTAHTIGNKPIHNVCEQVSRAYDAAIKFGKLSLKCLSELVRMSNRGDSHFNDPETRFFVTGLLYENTTVGSIQQRHTTLSQRNRPVATLHFHGGLNEPLKNVCETLFHENDTPYGRVVLYG